MMQLGFICSSSAQGTIQFHPEAKTEILLRGDISLHWVSSKALKKGGKGQRVMAVIWQISTSSGPFTNKDTRPRFFILWGGGGTPEPYDYAPPPLSVCSSGLTNKPSSLKGTRAERTPLMACLIYNIEGKWTFLIGMSIII